MHRAYARIRAGSDMRIPMDVVAREMTQKSMSIQSKESPLHIFIGLEYRPTSEDRARLPTEDTPEREDPGAEVKAEDLKSPNSESQQVLTVELVNRSLE